MKVLIILAVALSACLSLASGFDVNKLRRTGYSIAKAQVEKNVKLVENVLNRRNLQFETPEQFEQCQTDAVAAGCAGLADEPTEPFDFNNEACIEFFSCVTTVIVQSIDTCFSSFETFGSYMSCTLGITGFDEDPVGASENLLGFTFDESEYESLNPDVSGFEEDEVDDLFSHLENETELPDGWCEDFFTEDNRLVWGSVACLYVIDSVDDIEAFYEELADGALDTKEECSDLNDLFGDEEGDSDAGVAFEDASFDDFDQDELDQWKDIIEECDDIVDIDIIGELKEAGASSTAVSTVALVIASYFALFN